MFGWLAQSNLAAYRTSNRPATEVAVGAGYLAFDIAVPVLLSAAGFLLLQRRPLDIRAVRMQARAAIALTLRCAWVLALGFVLPNEGLEGLLRLFEGILLSLPAAAAILTAGLLHGALPVSEPSLPQGTSEKR